MFKRGLSSIIVTILMILIGLVGVGILWVAIKNPLDSGENIKASDCLTVDLSVEKCTYDDNVVSIVVKRGSKDHILAGAKILIGQDESQVALDPPGVLPTPLGSREYSFARSQVPDVSIASVGAVLSEEITCAPTALPVNCNRGSNLISSSGCTDGIDNDGDGWTDSQDPGCWVNWASGIHNQSDIDETNPASVKQSQCSDEIDNLDVEDITNPLADGNDPDCTDARDNNETYRLPATSECDDGLDNDGDSWIDVEDVDCSQSGNGQKESWFALTLCSDGIDNDRDGFTDKQDGQCLNARDDSEVYAPSNPACSDGIDNDADGLADFTVDPGCSSASDTSENSEVRAHNFKFKFSSDGYIEEINWTNMSGVSKRVSWNERGRYPSGSGIRYYLHSTLADQGGPAWKYFQTGGVVQKNHADITYTKVSETSDVVVVRAQDSEITITDTIRFYNNSIYITMNVTNSEFDYTDNVFFPIYLGGLILGRYDGNPLIPSINKTNSGINLLYPANGGTIASDYNDTGGRIYEYPEILHYSPVSVMWDSNMTVAFQYLSQFTRPDYVELTYKPWWQYNAMMRSRIFINAMKPGESRIFNIVISIDESGKWKETLKPYKDWFSLQNGGTTPSYCPGGPFAYLVGSNANYIGVTNAFNTTTNRYRTIGIKELFKTDATRATLQALGFGQFGTWQTAVTSACLIGNKDCSRDFIQECVDAGNTANCEFNGNVELIDPNIDAGRNRSKIKDFTQSYVPNNVDIFWYTRPCGEIYGANITYDAAGNPTFIEGRPSGYADVDLRNVTNRNNHFQRVLQFAQQGVKGIYYDASSCPGDAAYYEFVKRNLTATYGNMFFFEEGGRDINSLHMPQMPLIKNPIYFTNSSELIKFLVPLGTYYAGYVNGALNATNGEFDDVMAKGYQGVPLTFPPTASDLNIIDQGMKIGTRTCIYNNQSFANRYQRWLAYGSTIPGCAAPPQLPPQPCPA